ncbi:MAG: dipicolinate synthase subunit B [Ruminococcaceae bacterium]|nr:dipicolinate synthase subunit B [Oscillospiraceae bacterium]
MERKSIGFALTGSFCTFGKIFPVIEQMSVEYDITPIMSEISANTDTRFGRSSEHKLRLENITGKAVLETAKEVEPIGPKKLLDALIVAPCTGNSIAKIANGIADTSVTLAVKSHLRNKRPVVIAVSTNDGLGNNAKNIGLLLNMKNIYLVPFGQDDCKEKQNSLISDMSRIDETLKYALEGKQIQPVLI